MSHACEQMLVDDDSKEFLTINTHKGLFRYNRLPYGVSSAPGIFQRTMEGLLQGIPSTGVLLDNILISGPSTEEHLDNIEKVLKRLSEEECGVLGTSEVVMIEYDRTSLCPCHVLAVIVEFYTRFMYYVGKRAMFTTVTTCSGELPRLKMQ